MPTPHLCRALLGVVLVLSTIAGEATSDESIWTDYLTWLKGRNVGSLLGLEHYRDVLAGQNLSDAEVERRMSVITPRALRRPEAMRLWFNTMVSAHRGPDLPTPLVAEAIHGVAPGASLDVSMGQGRNSIFLARMGWNATGFDVSDAAIESALSRAAKAGVQLIAVRTGYQDFDFGRHRFDLIVMTYAYFPIREPKYLDRLLASLRPGGLLVFQHGFLDRDAKPDAAADYLGIPRAGELPQLFHKLEILRHDEVTEDADWRTGPEPRQSRTAKLIARKP